MCHWSKEQEMSQEKKNQKYMVWNVHYTRQELFLKVWLNSQLSVYNIARCYNLDF